MKKIIIFFIQINVCLFSFLFAEDYQKTPFSKLKLFPDRYLEQSFELENVFMSPVGIGEKYGETGYCIAVRTANQADEFVQWPVKGKVLFLIKENLLEKLIDYVPDGKGAFFNIYVSPLSEEKDFYITVIKKMEPVSVNDKTGEIRRKGIFWNENEEVKFTRIITNDFGVQFGMTKEEIKGIFEEAGYTLVDEYESSLIIVPHLQIDYYGVPVSEIGYSFLDGKLYQYSYIFPCLKVTNEDKYLYKKRIKEATIEIVKEREFVPYNSAIYKSQDGSISFNTQEPLEYSTGCFYFQNENMRDEYLKKKFQ